MDLNHLPIIDWELGKKLAGNKKEVAEELLGLLVDTLPEELSAIKRLYQAQNYSLLLQRVHKLHGALCYCGVPRLKRITSFLEIELKNNIISSLPALLDQFEVEVDLLLKNNPTHLIQVQTKKNDQERRLI